MILGGVDTFLSGFSEIAFEVELFFRNPYTLGSRRGFVYISRSRGFLN